MRRPLTLALLLGLLAALLCAPSAGAAVVFVQTIGPSPALVFDATPGERNLVSIDVGTQVTVADVGAPLQAGAGCTDQGAVGVTCPATGLRGAAITLGDQNDELRISWPRGLPANLRDVARCKGSVAVFDGSGDDVIRGSRAGERFVNGGGDDVLRGGRGEDQFDGGAGADTFVGGRGEDTLCYRGRAKQVRVDLDGVADDGASGESDLAGRSLENIVGGDGRDRLVGDGGRNKLSGGRGRDTLRGLGGRDTLRGGLNRDRLFGGTGFDKLVGGPGIDLIVQ